jgi:hypothetical protein
MNLTTSLFENDNKMETKKAIEIASIILIELFQRLDPYFRQVISHSLWSIICVDSLGNSRPVGSLRGWMFGKCS